MGVLQMALRHWLMAFDPQGAQDYADDPGGNRAIITGGLANAACRTGTICRPPPGAENQPRHTTFIASGIGAVARNQSGHPVRHATAFGRLDCEAAGTHTHAGRASGTAPDHCADRTTRRGALAALDRTCRVAPCHPRRSHAAVRPATSATCLSNVFLAGCGVWSASGRRAVANTVSARKPTRPRVSVLNMSPPKIWVATVQQTTWRWRAKGATISNTIKP